MEVLWGEMEEGGKRGEVDINMGLVIFCYYITTTKPTTILSDIQ